MWYQKEPKGTFFKDFVVSIHQSQNSAYFILESGTVLKFNRPAEKKR